MLLNIWSFELAAKKYYLYSTLSFLSVLSTFCSYVWFLQTCVIVDGLSSSFWLSFFFFNKTSTMCSVSLMENDEKARCVKKHSNRRIDEWKGGTARCKIHGVIHITHALLTSTAHMTFTSRSKCQFIATSAGPVGSKTQNENQMLN